MGTAQTSTLQGSNASCTERRLKRGCPIIDDAHLMDVSALRRIRLLQSTIWDRTVTAGVTTAHVSERARAGLVVALCAAHPLIELDLNARTEPVLPIDHLADRAVERAIQLLDALDRYRLAQYDLEHARHARSHAPEQDAF